MTAFDKKVNGLAARHRWNIEKQARAAAACPYKVGPLGRYIAPAIVQGMTATNCTED